jgi:hypothetical protein
MEANCIPVHPSWRNHWLALSLLIPGLLLAADPWSKKPEQWALQDVYRILSDSPWAPTRSEIDANLGFERRPYDLVAPPPNEKISPREDVWGARMKAPGRTPLPEVSVLWWSSKVVRLAQHRLRQLQNRVPQGQLLLAEELPDIVITVEGSEALRILRDAREDLHDTVYLELPNGGALDLTTIRFVEGDRAGEDYVAFHFPREANGLPTVTPDMQQVTFRCRATAKVERPSGPNALSLRVVFSPRKMRVQGQPDL